MSFYAFTPSTAYALGTHEVFITDDRLRIKLTYTGMFVYDEDYSNGIAFRCVNNSVHRGETQNQPSDKATNGTIVNIMKHFNSFNHALTFLLTVLLVWTSLTESVGQSTHSGAMLCENGDVKTFGRNEQCQLGLGFQGGSYNQPQSTGLTNAVAVATGTEHQLALLDDGSVWAWGHNVNGCCGVSPTISYVCEPQIVSLPACAVAVAAGNHFSMALLADSTIYAWGDDFWGQLGDGSVTTTGGPTPVEVSGITTAVAISAGGSHALALLADSTVRAWGRGVNGQLGNGASSSHSSPVQVVTPSGNLADIVMIDAGALHNVALKSDNSVFTWGFSDQGRLGIGTIS